MCFRCFQRIRSLARVRARAHSARFCDLRDPDLIDDGIGLLLNKQEQKAYVYIHALTSSFLFFPFTKQK